MRLRHVEELAGREAIESMDRWAEHLEDVADQPTATPDDVVWADVVLVYAGFTSTGTAHGGQESTLLSLYNVIDHFGGILVPPGYTDPVKFAGGNPYGVGKVVGDGTELETPDLDALDHMAERCVEVARALKVGRAQQD